MTTVIGVTLIFGVVAGGFYIYKKATQLEMQIEQQQNGLFSDMENEES